MTRSSLFLSCLILSKTSFGFVIPQQSKVSGFVASQKANLSELYVGSVMMETEEDARFILSQAKQCAYGECSIGDAKVLLREMLHVQSGCAAGTLAGHDLCEEQDVAADVVAHLREKAAQQHQLETGKSAADSVIAWFATADWTLVFAVLIISTVLTLQVPHDDIAMRIHWALQDWEKVLENKDEIPMIAFVIAPYVALSEFLGLAKVSPAK